MNELPGNAAADVAALFRRLAAQADEAAIREAQLAAWRRQRQEHRQTVRRALDVLAHYLDAMPYPAALQATWQATGIEPDRLARLATFSQSRNRKATRERLERRVMALLRDGRNNAEIAARVGIHPKSVSRIVRRISGGR